MSGDNRPFPVRSMITTFLMIGILSGCIVKKRTTYGTNRTITVKKDEETPGKDTDGIGTEEGANELGNPIEEVFILEKADDIIETALKYTGVRYKYGGITKRGMDCSGLLYVSFTTHDIDIPRVSHMIAKEAETIDIEKVVRGDLLFFKTNRRGKRINHVGLVVAIEGGDIRFIHSTTSRGVIVSSLEEGYWNSAFVRAARIL